MPAFDPVNDQFIALDGSSSFISIAYALNQSAKNTIEFILDFQMDALPTSAKLLMGRANALGALLQLDQNGKLSFITNRGAFQYTAASANSAIVAGKRYIARGIDDGSTIKLYINGTVQPTTVTTSTTAIAQTATATEIGRSGGTDYLAMKIFGAQIRQDGRVTVRFMPREGSGATLYDLSGYNQAITIGGVATEGTTFWWGSAWDREPMFPGSVVL